MSNKFDKIINLIKRTGDKIIVVDEKAEPQFAMMSIVEYEKLLAFKNGSVTDLTEDELLSKINRDIAIWKSEQKDHQLNNSRIDDLDILNIDDEKEKQEQDKKEDKEKYYFEPIDEDEEDFYELND